MHKKALILLFLTFITLFANDTKLSKYPEAQKWLQEASTQGYAAFNLGVLYHKTIKDTDKAIEWYKKAYALPDRASAASAASNLGYLFDDLNQYNDAVTWYKRAIEKDNKNALLNLALLYDLKLNKPKLSIPYYEKLYEQGNKSAPYSLGCLYEEKLHVYEKAIEWYKKAYLLGNIGGAHALALLYKRTLNNPQKAIEWYEKAARDGYIGSINNLGVLYHNQEDNIHAGAYFIALIAYGEPKDDILDFLKNDWKLDRDTLQKAYELQKTLDIPKHYTGGID